jgi:hypothetical protein
MLRWCDDVRDLSGSILRTWGAAVLRPYMTECNGLRQALKPPLLGGFVSWLKPRPTNHKTCTASASASQVFLGKNQNAGWKPALPRLGAIFYTTIVSRAFFGTVRMSALRA